MENAKKKIESYFCKEIVLLYVILSMIVTFGGIALLLFDNATTHPYYNKDYFWDSVCLIVLIISIIPCILWTKVYGDAKKNIDLTPSFNKLHKFFGIVFVAFTVISVLFLGQNLISYLIYMQDPAEKELSWGGILLAIIELLWPYLLAVSFIIVLFASFKFFISYSFAKTVKEHLIGITPLNKKRIPWGLEIFFGVFFGLIFLLSFKISDAVSAFRCIYFAIISAKHITEGVVISKYFKMINELHYERLFSENPKDKSTNNFFGENPTIPTTIACPNCRETNTISQDFCGNCGEKLK